VKEEVGEVTILVNNAGIVFIKPFLNHSLDEIAQTTHVNLLAHYWASNIIQLQILKFFFDQLWIYRRIDLNKKHVYFLQYFYTR